MFKWLKSVMKQRGNSRMVLSAVLGARSRSERAALPTGSIPPATLGSPLMSEASSEIGNS